MRDIGSEFICLGENFILNISITYLYLLQGVMMDGTDKKIFVPKIFFVIDQTRTRYIEL